MSTEKQRNYKDTVYRMLFKESENALSLYNSLNGTHYTDASMLEFNTLENAIYMSMKNDISFLIMNQMYLYEHQSTLSPNMALRNLFYVADLLQVFTKDKTLYSTKMIKLPTPHFVVFYNGTDKLPERQELKLSDVYEVPSEHPELELRVQILNINLGMNEELKEKCSVLKEYMLYVEKVREYAKSMEFKEAVEKAVEYCIEHNILREFLLRQRAEVIKVSIYEYDEERELKLIRADERELGEEIGEARGKEIGMKIGREEERKNTEEALKKVEKVTENTVKAIVSLYKKFGGSKEEAVEEVSEKCELNIEIALEKVNLYWE